MKFLRHILAAIDVEVIFFAGEFCVERIHVAIGGPQAADRSGEIHLGFIRRDVFLEDDQAVGADVGHTMVGDDDEVGEVIEFEAMNASDKAAHSIIQFAHCAGDFR
jgi:hypothetical protein